MRDLSTGLQFYTTTTSNTRHACCPTLSSLTDQLSSPVYSFTSVSDRIDFFHTGLVGVAGLGGRTVSLALTGGCVWLPSNMLPKRRPRSADLTGIPGMPTGTVLGGSAGLKWLSCWILMSAMCFHHVAAQGKDFTVT